MLLLLDLKIHRTVHCMRWLRYRGKFRRPPVMWKLSQIPRRSWLDKVRPGRNFAGSSVQASRQDLGLQPPPSSLATRGVYSRRRRVRQLRWVVVCVLGTGSLPGPTEVVGQRTFDRCLVQARLACHRPGNQVKPTGPPATVEKGSSDNTVGRWRRWRREGRRSVP